ncbi:MAG: hypothetical protein RIF39_12220, partial [Cyclobacteriaceae bacterium]
MKNIYLIFALFAITTLSYGQDDITICHTPAVEKFALMASNKDFNSQHQMPRVYKHVSEEGGKMIRWIV